MEKKKDAFFLTDQNLNLILNALDEGIHIVDEEGRTIFYNQKAAEIDGLNVEEVLGKKIFEAYPSLTQDSSTLMRTLKSRKAISSLQQSFINFRGQKITTVNTTVPLEFGNGQMGAMEISRDITQLEELLNSISHLRSKLGAINKKSKKQKPQPNNTSYSFKDIIGSDPVFRLALQDAVKASNTDSPVLLYGETGTGKELFAQSIHNASGRSHKPFIAQNCAALPKNLLEGLLFGTEQGSFTGARTRPGLFEQADGGSILLDELNSLDPALQAKLLRVLQEKKVRRIGGSKERSIDVRIIATMNICPEQAIEKGQLREDLFYRIGVVCIEIPPLRERQDDILRLSDHFIASYNEKFQQIIKGLSPELKEIFLQYNWPGNVRELQHVIESAFNLLEGEELITYDHLPLYLKNRLQANNVLDSLGLTSIPPLVETLEKTELSLIKKALKKSNNNISQAARLLKISRQSLQYKIKKYCLDLA